MATKEASQNVGSSLPNCQGRRSPEGLEQTLAHLGTDLSPGAKDAISYSVCAWALLLGQYEGSNAVRFAIRLARNKQPWPQAQPWVIETNLNLDWRVSELKEKIVVSRSNIPDSQLGDSSKIRTLLGVRVGGDLSACDTKTLINGPGTSQNGFDLITTIVVDESGENPGVDIQAQGHFASEQARAITVQSQHVLALVRSSPDSPLRDLNFLCDADSAKILEWNKNLPASVQKCVHEITYDQARLTPSAEAIFTSDGSMNYRDLIAVSNVAAQNLQEHGIGIGSVVPLYFEKSKWVVVAILAVIKTGATFLLLDPSHPKKRLRYMIETVQASVILCSKSQSKASIFGDTPILLIDDLIKPPETTSDKDSNAKSRVTPESDLYIMFTSGTTGRPKAFAVQHRAFSSSATSRAPLIKRDARSRVLQFAAFSFDPCIEDILTTLMFGGCICIPSEHERLNDLTSFIRRANVNTANVTPGVIDLLQPVEVPSLEVLILSGEAMKKRHVDTWGSTLNLMNGYGPSECCIKCALNPSVTIGSDPRNIGKAVGTVLWVVDALHHERLAPIGAVGELAVEGPTLSRGYLDRDETQKAFVKAPKWLADLRGDLTTQIYRTGDLVKYNLDGTIIFIGRRDSQVKIRGQRIELQEVEKTMAESLPVGWRIVSEAVIFQGTDEPTLTAFLYKEGSTQDKTVSSPAIFEDQTAEFSASVVDLVESVGKFLPNYMIPSAFIPIRHIPLTVHGKTDRAAIRLQASKLRRPPPVTSVSIPEEQATGEPTEMESVLKALWLQVLNIPAGEIERHTSFFAVGGDSLSAIRLVTAARSADWFLTASRIFTYPTLSSMAAHMEPFRKSDVESESLHDISAEQRLRLAELCNVPSETIQDVYPCTPIQEFWMGRSLQRLGEFRFQSVYELGENIDAERLKMTWTLMQAKYPILRTRIIKDDAGGFSQVVTSILPTWNSSETLDEFIEYDETHNIPIGKPLGRSAIIHERSSGRRYFAWIAHHCSFDGWSRQGLMRELVKTYQTGELNTTSISFKAFVNRIYQVDRSVHEEYWREQFSGGKFRPFLHLPASERRRITHQVNRTIPAKRLKASNVTLSTMVYVAWSIIISRTTGCTDVAFMTILSGRDWAFPGIEDVVGPTAALIPLLVHIEPHLTVSEVLESTQARLLGMTNHIHLGWGRISNVSEEAKQGCEWATVVATLPPGANLSDYQVPGFSVERERLRNDHPFRAQCVLGDGCLHVAVSYDELVITEPGVHELITNLASVLDQIVLSKPGTKVEEFIL